jgi:hypothetical protein
VLGRVKGPAPISKEEQIAKSKSETKNEKLRMIFSVVSDEITAVV